MATDNDKAVVLYLSHREEILLQERVSSPALVQTAEPVVEHLVLGAGAGVGRRVAVQQVRQGDGGRAVAWEKGQTNLEFAREGRKRRLPCQCEGQVFVWNIFVSVV